VEQCQIEINSVNCLSSWNYMQQDINIICLEMQCAMRIGCIFTVVANDGRSESTKHCVMHV